MPPSWKRQSRSSSAELGTWVLGGALFLAVVMAAAGLVYFRLAAADRPTLDRTSLCPTDGGPRSITVALLDTTDQWPETVRADVRSRFQEILDQVQPYGLLELRLLDPTIEGGQIVFSKCNPGDGSNLSEISGNPRMARKQWREQFIEPMQRALAGTLEQPESATSPILRTIQRLAIDRFRSGHPTRLILVSDMIEHTPEYSQYGDHRDLSFEAYKRTSAYAKQRADLRGAQVILLYISRIKTNSGKHIRFWADWVQDNDGHLVDAIKLTGVP